MKKYIEPKNRCIDIDLESLIADSYKGMNSGTDLKDIVNNGDQLVKGQESLDSRNLWDSEW